MNNIQASAAPYVERFNQAAKAVANLPDWLVAHRRAALARFASHGFPDPREEEWKYTNVRPIAKRDFLPATDDPHELDAATVAELASVPFGQAAATGQVLNSHRLVFVDGRFDAQLSDLAGLPAGVQILPLHTAIAQDHVGLAKHLGAVAGFENNSFTALNAAFIEQGAYLHIAPDTAVEQPIYLLFVSSAASQALVCHPRIVINAEAGSKLSIVEHFVGQANSGNFTNTVSELLVGPNSNLTHCLIQQASEANYHVGSLHVRQARDSQFTSHNINLGGRLVRNDINVSLTEPGANAILNGLFLCHQRQHIDNHVRVHHAAPHTGSDARYRGVADGHGRGVFKGRVLVDRNSQHIEALQNSANLLLSEQAEIDTKPELEIYADDVKCSHGATVGRLDETSFFYLRSRGIDADTARGILIFAFADDVLQRLPLAALRDHLEERIVGQLPDSQTVKRFV